LQKKKQKKLLFAGGYGTGVATTRRSKSFLLLFFKKEALSLLSKPPCPRQSPDVVGYKLVAVRVNGFYW
jgi:hypothetical protein